MEKEDFFELKYNENSAIIDNAKTMQIGESVLEKKEENIEKEKNNIVVTKSECYMALQVIKNYFD